MVLVDANPWSGIGKNHSASVTSEFTDQSWRIYTFLSLYFLQITCLHRIFGIPLNLFHISFGNPKISRIDHEFSEKIKTGIRKSNLMPVSKYCLFCVVSFANVKNFDFLKVYQYSRFINFSPRCGFRKANIQLPNNNLLEE